MKQVSARIMSGTLHVQAKCPRCDKIDDYKVNPVAVLPDAYTCEGCGAKFAIKGLSLDDDRYYECNRSAKERKDRRMNVYYIRDSDCGNATYIIDEDIQKAIELFKKAYGYVPETVTTESTGNLVIVRDLYEPTQEDLMLDR